ncbi:hypothetical protein Tco_0919417 [Tanacetum coccineum]
MSSPNRSTSDIEDAFSSMNILNYTSVSSDYFSASSESSSFNSSENPKENMIPPVFSSFYNNPYLKDVQAFYARNYHFNHQNPYYFTSYFDSLLCGLPRSIEGNVTASKPQTLEEAINIAQRLIDQIIKRDLCRNNDSTQNEV